MLKNIVGLVESEVCVDLHDGPGDGKSNSASEITYEAMRCQSDISA